MISKTVEIKLSGKELADELWELDCQEQADFFNKNGFVKDNFNHGCASIQIDRLTELLDENGKRFISKLYDSMQGWQDMRKEDEGEMKLIPKWQDKLLRCHFCGTNKSVKYAVELHGAICDNKPLEVCACNRCALLHDHQTEKGGAE